MQFQHVYANHMVERVLHARRSKFGGVLLWRRRLTHLAVLLLHGLNVLNVLRWGS